VASRLVTRIKEIVKADEGEIYDVELAKDLLEENRKIALENRKLLQKYDIQTFDVMGSIGSGKTSLIEKLIEILKRKHNITVFKGDLTTTIDAELIGRHGVQVVAINTGKECHLDANLVRKALHRIDLKRTDLLFIENVGNLICPAEFPLGSKKRIVVISVTEGPYMVVKHPFVFIDTDMVVINKVDLAQAMNVDLKELERDVKSINPNANIVATNCRSGKGIPEVISGLGL
jgi:hydrogenase nickel incorporation protein HypB